MNGEKKRLEGSIYENNYILLNMLYAIHYGFKITDRKLWKSK